MTKRLVFVTEESVKSQRYSADIERLIEVAEDAGYRLSGEDAYKAWAEHSPIVDGWLTLDGYDDADLLRILRFELEEIDD